MRNMKKHCDTPWVSASEVGSAQFCPQSLAMKNKGIRPSREIEQKQRAGDAYHALETKSAYRQQDKRCFVASYALGPQHPTTQLLRDWRDKVLLQNCLGKIFVQVYYLFSPVIIQIFGQSLFFRKISRSTVLWLARTIIQE